MLPERIFFFTLIGFFGLFAILLFMVAKHHLARWKVGLIAFGTFLWLLFNEIATNATSEIFFNYSIRGLFVSCSLIILFMYWLSLEFLKIKIRTLKFRNISVLVLMTLVISVIMFTDSFFLKFNLEGNGIVEKAPPGPLFSLGLIVYGYTLVNILVNFIYAYIYANVNVRKQIMYVAYSMLLFFAITFVLGAILPALGNDSLVWLAPYSGLIYVFGMSYAIFKYRLLEIELIIKRTTLYLGLVGFVTGVYAFILMVPYSFVGPPGSPGSILVMIVAAVVITATIQPLRSWLDEKTDAFFYQKKYDYQKVLEKVAKQLNTVVKMDEAINVVVDPFVNDMHLKGVGIYMREKAGDDAFICHEKVGEISLDLPDGIIDSNPLITYLNQEMKIVEPGEFRYQYGHLYEGGIIRDEGKAAIQAEMDHTFNAGLFIPLVLKNTLIGFIVLGEKKSRDQFTFRDLSLLETIASQLVTSMDNIRLYEQMLNNERLTIIGTMSASIAHEIRNPLASIKTFIQMLPDKVAKPEFIKRFNEIVPAEIERISGITADLLTFSKPSSPCLEPVDIRHLLERVVTLLAAQFRKRQIDVVSELQDLPAIQADSQQLFQVFLNMFLNSIQASEPGRMIKVSTRMKEDGQSIHKFHESVIYITIEDQGAGIKRKDMINIFQPFFTTKSEGTGLGLATCKRIVDAHRGDVFVESELGIGTKMTVMLPMKLTPEVILSEEVVKN